MWPYISKAAVFGGGCVVGASAATYSRSCERRQMLAAGEYYEHSGQYYQALGHAWDHFRRDFCIVYRPLYHCDAKENRFEAHVLATSHFDRFESKFRRVEFAELDLPARSTALPGPFWMDKAWGLPDRSAAVQGAEAAKALQRDFLASSEGVRSETTSGYGTRSHQERATKRML
eukprot:TRINITY_DN83176_c0_g1_i1.p1 TRINITY_DN83176_c0_g1~~TRINITY_DN83176_c0_g1_i1.p1  ORF type:complete len:181 (+),score=32.54 TRINITY_DN83176_c0_g1_i1:24-545(+)